MVVSQKWQTSGMQKYLRKKKIFSNGHVPNLYLTGSVYLFGFLFLHQAVETSQPCKTVQFSSSRSERFCTMDWQKEKYTKLAKDLYKYIYIWPICFMYWSIDIRHKRRECDMFHKTAAGTNYHFLQFHVGSYRNIDCKKCATYMNHIVTAGLNWLTY